MVPFASSHLSTTHRLALGVDQRHRVACGPGCHTSCSCSSSTWPSPPATRTRTRHCGGSRESVRYATPARSGSLAHAPGIWITCGRFDPPSTGSRRACCCQPGAHDPTTLPGGPRRWSPRRPRARRCRTTRCCFAHSASARNFARWVLRTGMVCVRMSSTADPDGSTARPHCTVLIRRPKI